MGIFKNLENKKFKPVAYSVATEKMKFVSNEEFEKTMKEGYTPNLSDCEPVYLVEGYKVIHVKNYKDFDNGYKTYTFKAKTIEEAVEKFYKTYRKEVEIERITNLYVKI